MCEKVHSVPQTANHGRPAPRRALINALLMQHYNTIKYADKKVYEVVRNVMLKLHINYISPLLVPCRLERLQRLNVQRVSECISSRQSICT